MRDVLATSIIWLVVLNQSILLRTAGDLFLTQMVITCPHQMFGLISLISVSSMASLTVLSCCMKKIAGRGLNVYAHFLI